MGRHRAGDHSRDDRPLVAVVGGGITGLAAAWALANAPDAPRVVVLEAAGRVGGKLAVGELDGVTVDLGAESMLARRPEALDLVRQVGLADDLLTPRAVGARVWSRGALHPLPTGTLMGVPSGVDGLTGLLAPDEVAAVRAEPRRQWPPITADVDVASFVRARVGAGVAERLVEPLLGGVYAGRAERLSLQATVPALWSAATAGGSVVDAAAAAARAGASTRSPVFAGLRGGVGRLPMALADALRARGVEVVTGSTVRALRRVPNGWRLTVGATRDEQAVDVQAVVLATPAGPTSRLLSDEVASAVTVLASIQYAGVAIVTMLLPRATAAALNGSGFLVPPVEGRFVKAATFSSAKWSWLDAAHPERVVVRTSVGRHGETADLQRDDDDLVARAVADLADLVGTALPVQASLVTRWGGGLPQYEVGHLQRVAAVRQALAAAPGVVVAGAAYEGVGIAACVASGTQAAVGVLTHLDALAARARHWPDE